MNDAIRVGERFPRSNLVAEPGQGWHVSQGMILICQPDLGDPATLQADRVWLTQHGPLIGLVTTVKGFGEIEALAALTEGESAPAWLTEPITSESRLLLTWVWVEHPSGTVVRVNSTTLSPHATKQLHAKAARLWATPISSQELIAATQDWQTAFPEITDTRKAAFVSSRLGS